MVKGDSQARGNSGVFLMGRYEVQVLDSYQHDTYADGQAAALYGQYPPLANAMRPPGQWQVYDIVFHRPHFGEGGKRPAVEFGQRTHLPALDERQARGGAVHDVIDRAGE